MLTSYQPRPSLSAYDAVLLQAASFLVRHRRIESVLPYFTVCTIPAAGVAAPDEEQLRRADALTLVAIAQQRQAGNGQR